MKTISAGEFPGMRAAKPAEFEEASVGAGVRAKALLFFVLVFFGDGRG